MKAAPDRRSCLPALCSLILMAAPLEACADLWTVENSVSSRIESNDSIAFSTGSSGTLYTLSLTDTFAASRQMENSASRLNAQATAVREFDPGQDRIDGQIGWTQSFNDPLNSATLALLYAQDFNNLVQTADVTQGRGRRRTATLNAAWTRALTERFNASAQASADRTDYDQQSSDGTDFRNAALSGSLSYRLTEVDTLSVKAGRSEYLTRPDTNRATTGDLNASLSRVLSDRHSASIGLGYYRTTSSGSQSRLACPVQVSLCSLGLVPYLAVTERAESTRSGLQYSVTDTFRFDETSDLAFSAGRQQSPSGAGVVVSSDTVKASVNHAFSETSTGTLSYVQSRSTYLQGEDFVRPQQRTLSASLSRQWSPSLRVQAGYQRTHENGPGTRARSNRLSLTAQYEWPRIEATR